MIENRIDELKINFQNDFKKFSDICNSYNYSVDYKFYNTKNKKSCKKRYFVHIRAFPIDYHTSKKNQKCFNFCFCIAVVDFKKRDLLAKNNCFYNLFKRSVTKYLRSKSTISHCFSCIKVDVLCLAAKILFRLHNKEFIELMFLILFVIFLIILAVFEGFEVIKRKEFFGWY